MEYVIGLIALWALVKFNRPINQLMGIGTAKIDVLEVQSTYEDAKTLQRVNGKVTKLGKIVTAQEIMGKLTKNIEEE